MQIKHMIIIYSLEILLYYDDILTILVIFHSVCIPFFPKLYSHQQPVFCNA